MALGLGILFQGSSGPGAKPESFSNDYSPSNVKKTGGVRHTQTDELRMSKYLAKSLNIASFNYPMFAYHFVNHAPGVVIKNAFLLFESLISVMAKKLDENDINDNEELEVAITAKRIQDAMVIYKT